MKPSILSFIILVVVLISSLTEGDGHDGSHKHIIIHVPYHIKTIKHVHTITKHIHHGGGHGDKYEILGYTVGHPIDLGGHGGHAEYYGGHENSFGGHKNIFEGHENSFGGHTNIFEGHENSFGGHINNFEGRENSFEGHENSFGGHTNNFEGHENSFGDHSHGQDDNELGYGGHEFYGGGFSGDHDQEGFH